MKKPKPEPVVVRVICSLCDQPWDDHGDEPTTEDCIRLLKAELVKRPTLTVWNGGTSQPIAYGSGYATINATSSTGGAVVEFRRPEDPPDEPMAAVS